MKIAFTGHRNANTSPAFLAELRDTYPKAIWVHGGAIGFDSQVAKFAEQNSIPQIVIRPDYARFGRGAPLVRNKEIVNGAQILVACYDGRKKGGTYFTINHANKHGIPVTLVPVEK